MQGQTPFIVSLLYICVAIIFVTSAHEYVRALISSVLGDPTPKQENRLSLNPMKHFEPIGFLLMFSTGFSGCGCGWGLPVKTNPRFYSNRKTGSLLVAIVPTFVNFMLAVLAAYLMKYVTVSYYLTDFFSIMLVYNVYMVVCNLLPVSPFDCMKVIMELVSKKSYFSFVQTEPVLQFIFMFLILTGMLNFVLVPIKSFFIVLVQSLVL